ncbi:CIR protein PIR protein [Plasmodium vinckei vinckei]|uniref:CIR protein PIR protein n=1 Tax=Plasmodium vinckei vinckei TaxID=54757 RepID=A0A449BVV1_PLAVN|nr:CIR protein PIR protein [Plasmodium vinckei vinckei]VEV57605.1 CIR protein PIR protein [Plasmodium vinckei vinckei]
MTGSGVIYLLKDLKDKYNLENDQLAEYAILWLSYKLNKNPKNKFDKLSDFYKHHILKNNCYNGTIKGDENMTYKAIIEKKNDLMNMKIKDISKFYEALKTLCSMYSDCNKSELDCNNCSEKAKTFANQFKELNKDSKNIDNISYSQMISTLSNDYDNLKYIYDNNFKNECPNLPSFPELTPQTSPVDNSVKVPGQTFGETSEGTSSNSSIASKLIPALSTFSVIPVFLGVAYKYSLFGIDKLFQRQYIRKKLKNIKKKMKLNI